jgi:hypothetical protein
MENTNLLETKYGKFRAETTTPVTMLDLQTQALCRIADNLSYIAGSLDNISSNGIQVDSVNY